MGIYLSAKLLLKYEDIVLVGQINYLSADAAFLNGHANWLEYL